MLIGFKHIEHKCSPPLPWGNIIQSSQAKISANDTKLNTISRKDIKNFLCFNILFIYKRFLSLKSNELLSGFSSRNPDAKGRAFADLTLLETHKINDRLFLLILLVVSLIKKN